VADCAIHYESQNILEARICAFRELVRIVSPSLDILVVSQSIRSSKTIRYEGLQLIHDVSFIIFNKFFLRT